jgi:hypothetical protein
LAANRCRLLLLLLLVWRQRSSRIICCWWLHLRCGGSQVQQQGSGQQHRYEKTHVGSMHCACVAL